MSFASLPMYDLAGLEWANGRLWQAICGQLRAKGFAAPESLTRGGNVAESWLRPDCLLSQTCGLPFVQTLWGKVQLLGPFAFKIDCAPGWYYSVVVVQREDERRSLEAYRGSRLALNERGSQSGYAAIMAETAPFASYGRFFGASVETGAHLASIKAVACGKADIAAVDCITWLLSQRLAPERRLRVLTRTSPTPGLPLITALGHDAGQVARAVSAGIGVLEAKVKDALALEGFVPMKPEAYRLIAERLAAAEALHRLP